MTGRHFTDWQPPDMSAKQRRTRAMLILAVGASIVIWTAGVLAAWWIV